MTNDDLNEKEPEIVLIIFAYIQYGAILALGFFLILRVVKRS